MKTLKPLFLAATLAFASSANAHAIIDEFTLTAFDDQIDLTWITYVEVENAYFSVQRSFNGNDWFEIGQVAGADNSDTIVNYGFVDLEPLPGENHYRLIAVDNYGNEEVYEMVLFHDYTPLTVCDFIVYPNPADEYLLMYFEDCPPNRWMIQIVSPNGFGTMAMPADFQDFLQLDVSLWPTGIYMIIVRSKGLLIQKQVFIN